MANATMRTHTSRPPHEIAIDRVWRFFCSVRAAVVEIFLLALLVLIGTLRGSNVPQWIAEGVPGTQGLVDRWYGWDVYRSPVFAILLAVIAIAIAICTINRVPGIWQTISNPKVRTSSGFLNGADTSATFRTTEAADQLLGSVTDVFRQKRYRILSQTVGNETHLYADRNRYGKVGTFPFHLALILLLVGGIVGAYYGFRDTEFVIPEGETRSVGHGTGLSVHLNRFEDEFTPGGLPATFRSDVSIIKDEEEVKAGVITVNHPMSFQNATFYQTSSGFTAQMLVTDQSGAVLYHGHVELGKFNFTGNTDAPAGFVQIPAAGVILTVVGPDTNPLVAPERDSLQLQSGQMWIQLQPIPVPGSPAMAPGQFPSAIVDQGRPATLANLNVTFEREARYTLLQVAYNPGIPIFLMASVLLVGGLVVTFYFPLRRIRGIIAPAPDGAVLTMAPLARRDWSGKREFFTVVERARERLNIEPTIRKPDDHKDWEGLTTTPSAGA